MWGRLARRDVWLVRQTRWKVVARAGDSETGSVQRWEFDSPEAAQEMIDRLLRAPSPGSWREQSVNGQQAHHQAGSEPTR